MADCEIDRVGNDRSKHRSGAQTKENAEMEKQLRKFIGLATLITAAVASGQIFQQVQVTVPFSFMAGEKSSPAGDYKVEVDRSRDLITLTSDNFKTFMLTTTFQPGNSGVSCDSIGMETNGFCRP